MNLPALPPVQTTMSSCTQPHGAVDTLDDLNFYPFGGPQEPGPLPRPVFCELGVVTLGQRGEFISRRPYSSDETKTLWAEHDIRHGIRIPAQPQTCLAP